MCDFEKNHSSIFDYKVAVASLVLMLVKTVNEIVILFDNCDCLELVW